MSHLLPDMIGSTMEKLHASVDTNMVVGEPITTPDGTTVIPISKVSFGVYGGGTDYNNKHLKSADNTMFGGGVGANVTVTPMSFMVIKDGLTRMITVAEPASTSLERMVEKAPEFTDKILAYMESKKDKEN